MFIFYYEAIVIISWSLNSLNWLAELSILKSFFDIKQVEEQALHKIYTKCIVFYVINFLSFGKKRKKIPVE